MAWIVARESGWAEVRRRPQLAAPATWLLVVALAVVPVGTAAVEPPGPDLDLTFVITPDPHYRLDPVRVEQNRLTIEELNRVTERTWPEKLGGGPIAVPRGVLAPGDLVDDGDKKDQTPGQWAHYVSHSGFDTDWWHPEDWAAFYEAVEPYNVILSMFGRAAVATP